MNKQELIKLKENLKVEDVANKEYYQAEDIYVMRKLKPFMLASEIMRENNVDGAIAEVSEILPQMIFEGAQKGIDIANLNVAINYSYFVTKTFLDLCQKMGYKEPKYNYITINDVLNNFLAIQMKYSADIYSGDTLEAETLSHNGEIFIVRFSEFVTKLQNNGFLEKDVLNNFNEFFAGNGRFGFYIPYEPSSSRARKINDKK